MPEQESLSQEQMNELLFMQLVMMFQSAALQHMGKVMNPVTQKVERDLAQAKNAIDILGMLEAKTKGNLGENEKKMLEHTLFELRMNYVDEVNKEEKEEKEEKPQEAAGEEETRAERPDEAEPEDQVPEDAQPEGGKSG